MKSTTIFTYLKWIFWLVIAVAVIYCSAKWIQFRVLAEFSFMIFIINLFANTNKN